MTKLPFDRTVLRETNAVSRGKQLIAEFNPHPLTIRPNGARWNYQVSYEAIFHLGAQQEAARHRLERNVKREKRT